MIFAGRLSPGSTFGIVSVDEHSIASTRSFRPRLSGYFAELWKSIQISFTSPGTLPVLRGMSYVCENFIEFQFHQRKCSIGDSKHSSGRLDECELDGEPWRCRRDGLVSCTCSAEWQLG